MLRDFCDWCETTPLSAADCAFLPVSNQEDPDMEYEPVSYRKVFLDDEDVEFDPNDEDAGSAEASLNQQDGEDVSADGDDRPCSDDSYRYSDDHESYSGDSEHDDRANQKEGVE